MATINFYLNFDGQYEEAFNFYKSLFGGEFVNISKFGEMPPQEGITLLSDELKNLVMNVSLPISAETNLMRSDMHCFQRFI